MADTADAPDLTFIPIEGSSVPGDPEAAYRYAHRLEKQWHKNQRTILGQRLQLKDLAERAAAQQRRAERLALAASRVLDDLDHAGLGNWRTKSEWALREALDEWEAAK